MLLGFVKKMVGVFVLGDGQDKMLFTLTREKTETALQLTIVHCGVFITMIFEIQNVQVQ